MSVRNKPSLHKLREEEEKFKSELLLRCSQLTTVDTADAGALQELTQEIKQGFRFYQMASTNLVQYHRMKGCPDEARNVLQERYFIQQQEVAECLKLLNVYIEGLGYETLFHFLL